MPDQSSWTRFRFDSFTVDAGQRHLYRLGVDAPVELPPRAFEALLQFVERPGELLTKKQLMKALWPDVVVEENNLNQVISLLRRVLGERPAEHRFIVTAPGRGYRFVAAVRTDEAPREPGLSTEGLSVAILPFVVGTDGATEAYLGDAFAADLIRALSLRPGVRITAQSLSTRYRSADFDVAALARKLNVTHVLVGQLARSDKLLSVSASLLEGASGKSVWSTTLQRELDDIVALQADLVRQTGLAMDSTIEASALIAPAVEPDAYLRYLRALSLSIKRSPQTIQQSITLLREALAISPGFARARSQLAIEYTTCVMFGFPVEGALDLARQEAAAALAQDDANGETYCAAAVLDCLSGTWSRAEERFRLAQTLTANALVSGLRCAYLTFSVGQLQRAMQQAEYTLRVAPTHPIGVQMMASIHGAMGRDDESRRYAELAVELGQSPAIAPLADVFSNLASRAGRDQEWTQHMLATLPERLRAGLDLRDTTSLRRLEQSLRPAEFDPPTRKRLILWYTHAGALDEAYDLAQRSLEHYARESTVGGAWGMLWVPEMRAFRRDGRFQPFARRLRLFEYWNEYGPPDGYALAADRLVAIDP